MKVLGIIFLVVIAIAGLASMGDDDTKAAPTSSATAATSTDTDRGVALTEKGQRLMDEIIGLAGEGIALSEAGDAAGACAVSDSMVSKVNEVGDVVDELGPITDTTELEQKEVELRESIGNQQRLCAEMGSSPSSQPSYASVVYVTKAGAVVAANAAFPSGFCS